MGGHVELEIPSVMSNSLFQTGYVPFHFAEMPVSASQAIEWDQALLKGFQLASCSQTIKAKTYDEKKGKQLTIFISKALNYFGCKAWQEAQFEWGLMN